MRRMKRIENTQEELLKDLITTLVLLSEHPNGAETIRAGLEAFMEAQNESADIIAVENVPYYLN